MRVLFLDMDGVVNHWEWWKRRTGTIDRDRAAARAAGVPFHHARNVDPLAVARLNRVCSWTGCRVVLSSTWRHGPPIGREITAAALKLAGARFELFDCTPDCARKTAGGLFVGAERGAEIQEWLDAHPEVKSFAIVDDDSDMGPLLPRLVRTSMESGLQDEHVERLVALLMEGGG